MARLRLSISSYPIWARDPDGSNRIAVPIRRLKCVLRIGSSPPLSIEVWIDTGSPLTLFPFKIWKQFESEVSWLEVEPGQPGSLGQAAGISFPYRVGRVEVKAMSSNLRDEFPPAVITAMFAEDGGKLRKPVVGLWGGILDGRRLRVEPNLAEAWIEDPGP